MDPTNLVSLPPEFLQELERRGLNADAARLGLNVPVNRTKEKLTEFLTNFQPLIELKEKIVKLAPANIPVLILGETGTGKELIAEALHGNRQGKFVPVNCAGIPDTLLESEFFGCVKGAYTGATNDRIGYVKEAEGGTLFLDEIGDMPTLLQSKILRLLQSKKYRRVGNTTEETTSFRLISATNKIDVTQISSGSFRLDLYYRLAGSVINLPNLHDRGQADIQLIVSKFSKHPTKVLEKLQGHSLKGNVRELLNIIEEVNVLGV